MLQEVQLTDIDARHPVTQFDAFWRAGLNTEGVFLRREFSPMKIPKILPWLTILEPVEGGSEPAFCYRLYGTGIVQLFGVDLTDEKLGTGIAAPLKQLLIAEILKVMEERTPHYSEIPVPMNDRDFIKTYRGVFPISHSGDEIDQVFVIIAEKKHRLF